jgi:DNA invertase Pin-like site-specific DNA recombinase
VYVRISDDKAEDAAGVGRQERDCRALVERNGWTIGEIYRENDTSAFRRRRVTLPDGSMALRVVRPAFRQMLDDLGAGLVDALVAYDLDRIARDPRDLEDLIDVVEQTGIPAKSVTGGLDLSNDAGITMARVLMAMANKSSRDTSRRVARKHLELAEQGKVGGGGFRGYGYAADGVTVVEAEAQIVVEMAERIIAGESLMGIAHDLTTRGVPTVNGGRWHARSVHSIVTKGRVAGLREHRGEVVGKAVWPAIIDVDTWSQVKLALEGRAGGGTTVFKRWLTGILICYACGRPLVGARGNSGPRYWCKPVQRGMGNRPSGCGKTAVVAGPAEDHVEKLVLAYLRRADVVRDLRDATGRDAAAHARGDLERDEDQLRELAGMWARRELSTAEYLEARKEIEARIEHGNQLLRAALPSAARRLLVADDLAAAWKDLDPSKRRDVCHVVFPQGIRVEPRDGRGRFDPTRLVPVGWE